MAEEARKILDDPQTYAAIDPSGLRNRLRAIPGQCSLAWDKARAFTLPAEWSSSNQVVIGGMGGSAMAGDLAADLALALTGSFPVPAGSEPQSTGPHCNEKPSAGVPILVVRDLIFPFSLDQDTIFVACSYSGNTEETLSLFEQAVHQPTQTRARTIAITGGGKLSKLAGEAGVPLLKVEVTSEPRTAVAYNLMLILGVLRGLRLLDLSEEQVSAAIREVSGSGGLWAEDVPVAENSAKRLALELRNKLIIVYGSGLFSGMARRWKSQFNENAKIWSFFETLPELLHNSVEAFGSAPPDPSIALILEPGAGGAASGNLIHGRHNRVITETLSLHKILNIAAKGEGTSPLAQVLNMLLLGDYVSYYLAMLRGVDPSPNPSIDTAKDILSRLT